LRRHPRDVVFIPVSIFFGFAHGFIKIIALFTWNVVGLASDFSWYFQINNTYTQTSWGSRPDGDINDSERMTPRVGPEEDMMTPLSRTESQIRYGDEKRRSNFEEKDIIDSGYGSEKSIWSLPEENPCMRRRSFISHWGITALLAFVIRSYVAALGAASSPLASFSFLMILHSLPLEMDQKCLIAFTFKKLTARASIKLGEKILHFTAE
jgi:hypothetical protein